MGKKRKEKAAKMCLFVFQSVADQAKKRRRKKESLSKKKILLRIIETMMTNKGTMILMRQ